MPAVGFELALVAIKCFGISAAAKPRRLLHFALPTGFLNDASVSSMQAAEALRDVDRQLEAREKSRRERLQVIIALPSISALSCPPVASHSSTSVLNGRRII